MHLYTITRNDIYINKAIPIFTEDEEARIFLNVLFDYYIEKNKESFAKVAIYFILLMLILALIIFRDFEDIYLLKSTMQAICILDGDQRNKRDINKNVIVLR